MDRNSCDSVWRAISAIAPAISTPVAPPPTSTNVSRRLRSAGSVVRSARSYATSIRALTLNASSSVFSDGACGAQSSWPK